MTDMTDIIDTLPLDSQAQQIASDIINEQSVDKVKDLTALFNLNQRKKNVIRLMKLNGLLDTISDQMLERFEKRAGEFSNNDLLNYMNVVQNTIDRTQKSLDMINESPAIQINQNNLNISMADGLERDERERVASAIKAILEKASQIDKDEHLVEIIPTEVADENGGN